MDIKMALLEAQRLGLDAPRSVSAFAREVLAQELSALRVRIDQAGQAAQAGQAQSKPADREKKTS